MKKLAFIIFSLLLFSCKSKVPSTIIKKETVVSERFVLVSNTEIDFVKKSISYSLGKRLLETCNTSRFKSFNTSEATEKVIQNATIEKISKTCQKMNMRNGKFLDINLIEIIHDTETDSYDFRYDIVYEKKYFKRELRVILNTENKVSAITTKEIPVKPL